MRRRSAFPDLITIQHQGVTGTDSRNNEVRGTTSTIIDLPARIDNLVEAEEILDRDRSTNVYVIQALPSWHGVDVEVAAEDTILWEGLTLQVIGPAAIEPDRMGRLDHIAIKARRIIG